MADKKVTLHEARARKQLDRFIEAHPSEGDEDAFDRLVTSMASGKPKAKGQTSGEASGED